MKTNKEEFLKRYREFINLMKDSKWAWLKEVRGNAERENRIERLISVQWDIMDSMLTIENEEEEVVKEQIWNQLNKKHLEFIKEVTDYNYERRNK